MRRFTPRRVAAAAAIVAAIATCTVGTGSASAAPHRVSADHSLVKHTQRPADWHWP